MKKEYSDDILNQPVSILNLSVRARKALFRLGCKTIAEVVLRNEDELLEIKNSGPISVREIKEKLGALGLRLRERYYCTTILSSDYLEKVTQLRKAEDINLAMLLAATRAREEFEKKTGIPYVQPVK